MLATASRLIAASAALWFTTPVFAEEAIVKSCFDFETLAYEDAAAANRALAECYPRGTDVTALLPRLKRAGETTSGYTSSGISTAKGALSVWLCRKGTISEGVDWNQATPTTTLSDPEPGTVTTGQRGDRRPRIHLNH